MAEYLDTADADFEQRFETVLGSKREDAPDVDAAVAEIIADVRARGDDALIELTAKFDGLELTPESLAFSAAEIDEQCAKVPAEERSALELAACRIRAFHQRQMPEDAFWTDEAGASGYEITFSHPTLLMAKRLCHGFQAPYIRFRPACADHLP